MARSFGKEDGDKENSKKHSQAPDPKPEGAAWNGEGSCGGEDDADSTVQIVNDVREEIREDAAEGHHLYLDFVRTEIMRSGMEVDMQCLSGLGRSNEQAASDIVDPQRLMDWTRAGQELRQLADAFSRSKERQSVKQRAQDLALDSLDCENFFQLLQELFQVAAKFVMALSFYILLGGGVTRERILVLFFFCADVAIEALRRGFHQTFHQLLRWSLKYIVSSVAEYVHSVGGWGVVLRQSLDIAYNVTACCAFVAVVAACVVYIRRNLS